MDAECYHNFLSPLYLSVHLQLKVLFYFYVLGFTKAEKIWSILNLKTFIADIIFSINSTLLLAVRTQAAEILQLSVL